jgi:hypothetical protein
LGPQKVRGIISAIGHIAPGDYVMLYDGIGTFQLNGMTLISSVPGRIEFRIAGRILQQCLVQYRFIGFGQSCKKYQNSKAAT